MRALVQHLLAFVIVGLAVVLSGRAAAQSDSAPGGAPEQKLESAAVDALISNATATPEEETDEVTVKGRKSNELARYRLKMTQSRDKIVEVFNKVNSTDDTDVKCRSERPTGTRLSHNVCRSKAEEAASAGVARGMLDSLLFSSGLFITNTRGQPPPAGGPQVNALIGTSKSRQEGVVGEEQARAELEAELKKMMAENRDLYRATVEYVEARNDYNKVRGQGTVVTQDGNLTRVTD